jgi:hypothetical protein
MRRFKCEKGAKSEKSLFFSLLAGNWQQRLVGQRLRPPPRIRLNEWYLPNYIRLSGRRTIGNVVPLPAEKPTCRVPPVPASGTKQTREARQEISAIE